MQVKDLKKLQRPHSIFKDPELSKSMGELPEDIIYNILSRMPVKSLDRFRCVCKEWCKLIDEPNLAIIQMNRAADEPMPIMSKRRPRNPNPDQNARQILTLFRTIESKEGTTMLEAKKNSVLEIECTGSFPNINGCCNGLLYLSECNNCETTLSVIHPLRKERYVLPPLLLMRSFGLGFDASTNTFKMCVSVREANYKILHIMVHVLGTNSWREIPQIPYYLMKGYGVFSHGCLHWLGYHNQMSDATWMGTDMQSPPTHRFKVIRFDLRKEEFEVVDPLRKLGDDWVELYLVDLHAELGLVYGNRHSYAQELWVLKQNQWEIQCRFDAKPPLPYELLQIVGLWNKSGDILVAADAGKRLFVYSLKSRGFHEVNLVGREDGCQAFIHMYRSSLFTISGIKKSVLGSSNLTPFNVCISKTRRGRKRKRKISIPSKVIYRFFNFC